MRAACPANVILVTFSNLMTFYEEYKLRDFNLCNFLIKALIHIRYIEKLSTLWDCLQRCNRIGRLELRTLPFTTVGHTDKTCKNYQSISVHRLGELARLFSGEF